MRCAIEKLLYSQIEGKKMNIEIEKQFKKFRQNLDNLNGRMVHHNRTVLGSSPSRGS